MLLVALFATLAASQPFQGEPISVARALELLPSDAGVPTDAGIADVLRAGLASDADAVKVALELYAHTGDVVGVLAEQDMEGGYRGTIHLMPQLPTGASRKHLEYVALALSDFDSFFAALEQRTGRPVKYRWRGLELRFFRSLRKRTPAAFAQGWAVAYNVNGTLNGSAGAVRDLLFHELFHLNDADHSTWSSTALSALYERIVKRCGVTTTCLTPYAPDPLIVHGGTYYSFMPGNGVQEYAADLALRYSREQRAALAGKSVAHPFKCGPQENAAAWKLLVEEFFAGADAVPECAR